VVNGGSQTLLSRSGTPNAASVTLSFTPTNWSTAQTVNVLPVNDTQAELRHIASIQHTISAGSAPEYVALGSLPSVNHLITDNDNNIATNLVRIVESGGSTSVTESATADTITVTLASAPTADVVLTFSPDSQLVVSPSSITFTPADFSTAQTVTLRAIDDAVMEPYLMWATVTCSSTSTDPAFNNLAITPVTSSVYDNDGPWVQVLPSGGSTIVTESGRTDTYQVVLNREPAADVVISITPDAQLTTDTSALTFTTANWSVPQTVTVTAVDDTAAEAANHTGVILHSVASSDPLFHNLGAARIAAQVWDNDGAGITASHTGGDGTSTVVTEGGSSDTILIKANKPLTGSETVTITLYPPSIYVPPPLHGKTAGYFTNDLGGNNNRDNIVIDYTESILHYRQTFYDSLHDAHGGSIPSSPSNTTVQNAHWAASRAVIDQMDLWFCGGSLKARNPVLREPNQPPPFPLPPINPRQTIIEAIYAHNGGSNLPATTRYEAEIPFDPKAPSTTTFATEVRDRVRWAGYLMTVAAPGLISH
jgi:hypothetical protein